jgi:hypothetical protein
MDIYWLILGVLAVWRVTHLLQAEDGPWDLVVSMRRKVGNGFWGKLLDCFNCLSLWVAVLPAWLVGSGWKEWLFLWLAFSGGAILLEQLTRREPVSLPAIYYEDEEAEYAVLRKSEDPAADEQADSAALKPGG